MIIFRLMNIIKFVFYYYLYKLYLINSKLNELVYVSITKKDFAVKSNLLNAFTHIISYFLFGIFGFYLLLVPLALLMGSNPGPRSQFLLLFFIFLYLTLFYISPAFYLLEFYLKSKNNPEDINLFKSFHFLKYFNLFFGIAIFALFYFIIKTINLEFKNEYLLYLLLFFSPYLLALLAWRSNVIIYKFNSKYVEDLIHNCLSFPIIPLKLITLDDMNNMNLIQNEDIPDFKIILKLILDSFIQKINCLIELTKYENLNQIRTYIKIQYQEMENRIPYSSYNLNKQIRDFINLKIILKQIVFFSFWNEYRLGLYLFDNRFNDHWYSNKFGTNKSNLIYTSNIFDEIWDYVQISFFYGICKNSILRILEEYVLNSDSDNKDVFDLIYKMKNIVFSDENFVIAKELIERNKRRKGILDSISLGLLINIVAGGIVIALIWAWPRILRFFIPNI